MGLVHLLSQGISPLLPGPPATPSWVWTPDCLDSPTAFRRPGQRSGLPPRPTSVSLAPSPAWGGARGDVSTGSLNPSAQTGPPSPQLILLFCIIL